MMSASAPLENGPLLRIHAEDLGDVSRGHGDEFVGRETGPCRRQRSTAPATGPSSPPVAVGDLGEVAHAIALLLGGEGAVIGGDDLQRAGPEGLPTAKFPDAACCGKAGS